MPDAATLGTLVQLFGPLGAIAIMVAYGVWQKPSGSAKDVIASPPVSKEYEKTMAVMMGRIAETLETQTAILDKIERQIGRLIDFQTFSKKSD